MWVQVENMHMARATEGWVHTHTHHNLITRVASERWLVVAAPWIRGEMVG